MLLPLLAGSAARGNPADTATSDTFWILNTRYAPQEAPCYDPTLLHYQRWTAGHVDDTTQGDFLQSLPPQQPVCFFIHGNLTDAHAAVRDGHQAYAALRHAGHGRPMTFVLVSWPSERVTPIVTLDLGVKAKRSDATAYYLAELLAQVPSEQPVCLIGHSLGARTAAGSLHLLGGGSVRGFGLPGGRRPHHLHTALLAASIDHDWLNRGDRFGRALGATQSMMIFTNRRDAALGFYPLRKPFSPDALGKVGLRSDDWARIDGHDGEKISEVEMAELIGCRHHVSAYFGEPAVSDLLAPLVYFSDTPTDITLADR